MFEQLKYLFSVRKGVVERHVYASPIDGYFVVVKLFDKDEGSPLTVKFWRGDVERTASFWSTKERFMDPKGAAAALREASKLLDNFTDPDRESSELSMTVTRPLSDS